MGRIPEIQEAIAARLLAAGVAHRPVAAIVGLNAHTVARIAKESRAQPRKLAKPRRCRNGHKTWFSPCPTCLAKAIAEGGIAASESQPEGPIGQSNPPTSHVPSACPDCGAALEMETSRVDRVNGLRWRHFVCENQSCRWRPAEPSSVPLEYAPPRKRRRSDARNEEH